MQDKASAYTPRVNVGGNFCGHSPDSPRLELPSPPRKGPGGIPRVLTLLMERLPQYYWSPRRVLPSLDLANGSQRQQRTERREACIDLIKAILKYTDLSSLRVGIPTKDGFMCMTLDFIAKEAGIGHRRAERALRDLKSANLITVSQPRQLQPDGSWKGLAAIKAVSRHLFSVFGLEVALRLEQGKAVKRLKRKAQQIQSGEGRATTLGDLARVKLITGMTKQATRATPRARAGHAKQEEELQRAYTEQCAYLLQEHPEWPPDKIREHAKQLAEALMGKRRA